MYKNEFIKSFEEKNKERIPHDGEIELCLCSNCAAAFYTMPDHGIERVYKYQFDREPCTICNSRYGYDFYVWQLPNVRNSNSHI